jgi:hypothetical protein
MGYCEKHRTRWRRHGDPLVALKDHTPATERWKTSYVVDEKTECWVWTGPVGGPYGFIQEGAKKRHKAHRFVYEQVVGPVPPGAVLDHKCRNTLCINPKHLEPVTHALNVQRGDAGINNALKTHCKYGHEFTPENTAINSAGHRHCLACRRRLVRDHMRKRRGSDLTGPPRPNAQKTHCKHGHEFTPKNTYVNKRGARVCRDCQITASRSYQLRKRKQNEAQ